MQKTKQFRGLLSNKMVDNRTMNRWLIQEVGPSYDSLKASPERALTIEQVKTALADIHKKIKQTPDAIR